MVIVEITYKKRTETQYWLEGRIYSIVIVK